VDFRFFADAALLDAYAALCGPIRALMFALQKTALKRKIAVDGIVTMG
jgi:hypothetical protein